MLSLPGERQARTERRMASSQLVHCHACRHRFSWRGGDLACPQCASDMVEILEPPGSISSTPLIPSISSTPSIPSSAPGGGGRSVDPQIPGPAPLAFSTMFELFVDGLVGQMLGSGSRIAARASRVHTRPVSRAVIDGLTEVRTRPRPHASPDFLSIATSLEYPCFARRSRCARLAVRDSSLGRGRLSRSRETANARYATYASTRAKGWWSSRACTRTIKTAWGLGSPACRHARCVEGASYDVGGRRTFAVVGTLPIPIAVGTREYSRVLSTVRLFEYLSDLARAEVDVEDVLSPDCNTVYSIRRCISRSLDDRRDTRRDQPRPNGRGTKREFRRRGFSIKHAHHAET